MRLAQVLIVFFAVTLGGCVVPWQPKHSYPAGWPSMSRNSGRTCVDLSGRYETSADSNHGPRNLYQACQMSIVSRLFPEYQESVFDARLHLVLRQIGCEGISATLLSGEKVLASRALKIVGENWTDGGAKLELPPEKGNMYDRLGPLVMAAQLDSHMALSKTSTGSLIARYKIGGWAWLIIIPVYLPNVVWCHHEKVNASP